MRLVSLTIALLLAVGITAGQTPPAEDDDSNIIAGRPLELVKPEHPPGVHDMSGVVRINIKVDKKGKVTDAYPLSGPVIFHAASEKAARETRFIPATRDKKPVNFNTILAFSFDSPNPRCTDRDLRVVLAPKPGYSDRAVMAKITGSVVLRITFEASGELSRISVVKGLEGGLTERAIEAAKAIIFIPECKKGVRVSTVKSLTYSFRVGTKRSK